MGRNRRRSSIEGGGILHGGRANLPDNVWQIWLARPMPLRQHGCILPHFNPIRILNDTHTELVGSRVQFLGCAPPLVPAAPPSPVGCCGAHYCLTICPGLNGPKPTAHEYLSFPCLLSPENEGSKVCTESSVVGSLYNGHSQRDDHLVVPVDNDLFHDHLQELLPLLGVHLVQALAELSGPG